MLKPLAALAALIALAAPPANAGSLPVNPAIHVTGVNTTTLQPGRTFNGYPSYTAPPAYGGPRPQRGTTFTSSQFNDPTGNLNPGAGGGGSGTTTVKKPNLQ